MVGRVRVGRGENGGERDRAGAEQQRAGQAQVLPRTAVGVGLGSAQGIGEALGTDSAHVPVIGTGTRGLQPRVRSVTPG